MAKLLVKAMKGSAGGTGNLPVPPGDPPSGMGTSQRFRVAAPSTQKANPPGSTRIPQPRSGVSEACLAKAQRRRERRHSNPPSAKPIPQLPVVHPLDATTSKPLRITLTNEDETGCLAVGWMILQTSFIPLSTPEI